eukprot:m.82182 g.82182  ORF g.82182 m.82182 type:complete len:540 (-) comp13394_c2_seq1:61-1680(-)
MGDTSKTVLLEGEASAPRMTNRQQVLRVSYLGVCFCLLFTAFSTARSYLTTVFPTYGYWSFFMMYIGFMMGSVSAVPMVHRTSPRHVMFAASLSYVVFLSLINTGNVPLFLASSLTMGMGAGSIWVAQALYLMRTSTLGAVQLGRLTAIFFAIWSLSSLFGSSLAILAIRLGLAASGVFWIMTGVCMLSCTMFFFVRNVPHTKPRDAASPVDVVRRMFSLVPQMPAHLIIYGMHQGFGLLLIWAVLPTLVSPDLDKISVVIVAYSISATAMSYVWGYLFDHHGMFVLLSFHFLNGAMVVVSILSITATHSPWYIHIVCGLLAGSYDQCNNNLITTLVKHCLPERTDMGVGVYRLSFAVAIVIFSTVALYVPYYVFVSLCMGILTLGYSLFLRDHFRTRSRRRNALPPLPIAPPTDDVIAGSESPVRPPPDPLQATHSALALIAKEATPWQHSESASANNDSTVSIPHRHESRPTTQHEAWSEDTEATPLVVTVTLGENPLAPAASGGGTGGGSGGGGVGSTTDGSASPLGAGLDWAAAR